MRRVLYAIVAAGGITSAAIAIGVYVDQTFYGAVVGAVSMIVLTKITEWLQWGNAPTGATYGFYITIGWMIAMLLFGISRLPLWLT